MPDTLDRLHRALAGRYAIKRVLGVGGMATVYLARDLRHDRDVAVKVLRPDVALSLGRDRFLREIHIAAGLQHPNILPVYDSGEAGGFLYYVMPFVDGESLRERLRHRGELPVSEIARILHDVAEALAYAHTQGVVHRDVKPENVMLSGRHALVADFGVARAISEARGDQSLTLSGVTVGTPAYMAPEQAVGDPQVDHRADLYAFGITAYEMLTGRTPFTSPDPQALLAAHMTVAPMVVTERRATVPPSLAHLVMRCLEKKPADRLQSADELLPVLEAVASGQVPPTVSGPATAPRARGWRRAAVAGAVLLALLVPAAAGRWWLRRGAGPRYPRSAVAVLPFQNLSAGGPYGYFAGGLHDEMLTQLAKVSALSVRGRTSVMGYAGTTKAIGEIADELSVGSIVEGSVQVVGDRLRVNVQLVDAATDEHLWAESYDRTLDDAFAVQSEIAQRIAGAVGATIGATERVSIEKLPTANAEAYRLYLQGLAYYRRAGRLQPNWEMAERLYRQAVALDTGFALARAALSEVNGRMFWYRYDPSPARADRSRAEAEAALRLAPDLPQAHVAMGLAHYWGRRDYRAALAELEIALERLPNDAQLWTWIAAVRRRMGNWDGALEAVEKATRLDPLNADLWVDPAAGTYRRLRRYAEAVQAYDRAVAIMPDYRLAALERGLTWVEWTGQLDTLRGVLRLLPPDADFGEASSARLWQALLLLWERKHDDLVRLLAGASHPVFDGQSFYWPVALWAGWAHQLCDEADEARNAFARARGLLDSVIRQHPDDWRLHAARGLALAGLGRREDALREAAWLEGSAVYREDALLGTELAQDRALILAQVREIPAALDQLDRLLSGPGYMTTVHTLRLDPRWDPIRSDPGFETLLRTYATPVPVR